MAQTTLETAFAAYRIVKPIGEGGSGRVYEVESDEQRYALKILSADKASSNKLKRFKNEIGFLGNTKHKNIVQLIDHGLSKVDGFGGPFYVMPLFAGSLRQRIGKGLPLGQALSFFYSMLDGVEAAHLLGAVHRDLKPENFVCNDDPKSVAVADFGIASFKIEELWTVVETGPNQRLANFAYAAPEQRDRGATIGIPADIFALGMILNELITSQAPYGEDYRKISSYSEGHAYLDKVVAMMLKRDAAARPQSIADVKSILQRYETEQLSRQKLDSLRNIVIPEGENLDPLAHSPPRITNVDWENGTLIIFLDHNISNGFLDGLANMGSHSSVYGKGPETFRFDRNMAIVDVRSEDAQRIIDHFKEWMPKATASYAERWQMKKQSENYLRLQALRVEREAEERRQKLLANLNY